ncbi:MAG: dynamin family protein [Myxococcales bacterium]|nr:dynamin family protein [Myxococcales bacterium]
MTSTSDPHGEAGERRAATGSDASDPERLEELKRSLRDDDHDSDARADAAEDEDGDGEDEDSIADNTVSTLRSFGSTLGGWAKRVGSLISEVSTGQPTIPEAVRAPLETIRTLRLRGQLTDARVRLERLRKAHPELPAVTASLGLTLALQAVLEDTGFGELNELVESLAGQRRKPPFFPLLSASRRFVRGEHEDAIDDLRRNIRRTGELPEPLADEYRFFGHLLGTMTQARRGRNDRALLELHRARVELPEDAGPTIRQQLMLVGVRIMLAEDHLDEAAAWLRATINAERERASATGPAPADPRELNTTATARAWLARTLSAMGDRAGAIELVDELGDEPVWNETRLRVALCVGPDDAARTLALRYLQAAPASWVRQRLWALTELAHATARNTPLPDATRAAIVQAIIQATTSAPAAQRDRFLQELAHVSLRVELLEGTGVELIDARVSEDPDTATEELRVARTRMDLRAANPRAREFFLAGPPPQFRAQPDLGAPLGPDEVSPLRDPATRMTTLRGQIALATAEHCIREGNGDTAQEFLVEALSEAPRLQAARELLAELGAPVTGARLEDLLGTATRVLAQVPNHVLGVPLTGVQDALSGVIAARERLARPLTIAIMGEFSSGKSTFVNALLGEAIAPMGVLPTTSTINVFRRGPSGGARVHYRDGSISTLARDQVQPFLHGLDDVEASRIRHMEIERTGAHMGDAAVVDTPGLNALDGFHERVARDFIEESDAVVWIFSATRGGAASEAGMLNSMRADGRQVLGIVNKVDTLEDDEREELCEYIQEQFGDVLVDVIPVCATEALEYRAARADTGRAQGDDKDPFAAVEHGLEDRFLKHARQLKRSVTSRRLRENLTRARASVQSAVDSLARRAETAERDDGEERSDISNKLREFADRVHDIVLNLDDLLTREALALGVLSKRGSGRAKPMTEQDDAYLNTVLRDAALRALQSALGELTRESVSPVLTDVLGERLIPWAHGYLESLDASGFFTKVLQEHGKTLARGEAALRERLRTTLAPIAMSWRRFVRSLDRDLRRALVQRRRRAASAPRAEILRLQTTAIASIDALLAGLDTIDP